jgi:hypothetical protein
LLRAAIGEALSSAELSFLLSHLVAHFIRQRTGLKVRNVGGSVCESFNLTNTARFDVGSLQAFGNDLGGNLNFTNSASFGNFTSTSTKSRVMQFALRYSF